MVPKPAISVVVPTHSRVDLFLKTLASLKAQTLKDFELIVTDDSVDPQDREAIKAAVSNYQIETSRVALYLFTQPKLGQAGNTNQGLRAASAELVRILHSDDLLHPECLAWECDRFKKLHPLGILFQDCIPFYHEADIAWKPAPLVRVVEPYQYFEKQLAHSTALPSGTVFRREVLEKVGLMRENWSFLCDWDLFARMLLWCGKNYELVAHATAGLFAWRLHADSTTATKWKSHFVEHEILMQEWQVSLPKEHPQLLEDEDLRTAFFASGTRYRYLRVFSDSEQLSLGSYLANLPWLFKNVFLKLPNSYLRRKSFSHGWKRLRGKKAKQYTYKPAVSQPRTFQDHWIPDLTISPFYDDDGATPNQVIYVKEFDNRLNTWPIRQRLQEAQRIRINHLSLNYLFGRSLHECLKHIQPGTEIEFFFHDNEHLTWFGLKAVMNQYTFGRFVLVSQNKSPQEGTRLTRSSWTIRYRCIAPAKPWHTAPLSGITIGVLTQGTRIKELSALIQTAKSYCPFPLQFILVCPGKIPLPEIQGDVEFITFTEKDEYGWITKKKNLICQAAKYSDIIVCHDRFEFTPDFFKTFSEWGHAYGLATPKIELLTGERALDWAVVQGDNHAWSQGGLLHYRDYSASSYAPGGVTLIRKSFWEQFPWAEDLFWNEHEDVELSRRVQKAGEFIYLFPGKVVTHHDRWVKQNPLLPFLSLKR
jgi:GT2 family glycosyltransferase